jgi:hypothetical protein
MAQFFQRERYTINILQMFKILDLTKDNLIAFKVKGKIEKSDYDVLQALLEKTEREFNTRKLYVEIDSIEGIEPAALWEDVKTYFRHFKDLDKIAFIGPESFISTLAKMSQPFVAGDVKVFRENEVMAAREWIMD